MANMQQHYYATWLDNITCASMWVLRILQVVELNKSKEFSQTRNKNRQQWKKHTF